MGLDSKKTVYIRGEVWTGLQPDVGSSAVFIRLADWSQAVALLVNDPARGEVCVGP